MPKFLVTMQRTIAHTTEFTVSAPDEDAAAEKAEETFNDIDKIIKLKLEWNLDDEQYEVLEVSEE